MSNVRSTNFLLFFTLSACVLVALTGCSSGSSTIDQLLGNFSATPILTPISNQIVAQGDQLTLDFNNIENGTPGDDAGMTYSCYYDTAVDGTVAATQACKDIPNSTVSFNPVTGIFNWTPSTQILGNYEIKVTGKNSDGQYEEIFQVGVRLKFNGLNNFSTITGTGVTANWTANPAAVGYQIFKLNTSTGLFELYQSVSAGSTSSVVITGLAPDTGYTFQVQALDTLGFLDGNVLSRSVTTTTLTRLALSPASQTVISGAPLTIQVQAYDNSGAAETVGGIILTPQIQSGTSTGNFSAVTDHNNGTYSFSFSPQTVGSAIDIGVTADTSFFLMNPSHLIVAPGAANSVHSTLASSASTVVSGQSVTLTATLKDVNDNAIDSSSVVSFAAIGGTSTGTISSVTNVGGGVYTATYSGIKSGTAQTFSVSVNGTTLTPTVTVQVLPGSVFIANSSFTVSAGTVASGGLVNLSATLKDLNNNPIDPTSTVAFNKSGGTSTGILSSITNASSGVYTATYTGIAAGTANSVSVNVAGVTLPLSVNIQVVPGAATLANSTVTISSPTVVSGNFVTVTATLMDANSNPIDSGITVSFSKAGGTSTGTFGTVSNQGAGAYNIRYTGIVSGTAQTLHVLVGGVDLGLSINVQVLVGAPSGATSTITAASTVISGALDTVTATIKDANNNPISSGITVDFAKSGGTSTGTFSAVTNNGNGVYQINYQGASAGSAQTINVLIDGSPLGPTTPITVLPGAPSNALSTLSISSSTVTAGQSVTLTATIKDANSNPISSGILVGFDKTGGTSFGTFGTVVNQGGGVYTVTYSGVTAGSANTVSATVSAADFGPTQTVQVLVGTPSSTTSTLTIASTPLASGNTANITAVIKDAYNNPITTEYTITFDTVGGSSTGNLGGVTNSGGGTFLTTYDGLLAGTAQTLRVLANSSPISGLTKTIQVVPGAVSAANSIFSIGSSVVQAGTTTSLSMNLRDINNNTISTGATVTFNKSGASDGTISAVTNNGNGNYAATYTGTVQGTAEIITLVVNSVVSGLSVSVTVTSGPPTHMTVSAPTNPISSIDCVGPYTMTLKDANNNTTSSLADFNVALSSAPVGALSGVVFTDSACSTSAVTSLLYPALQPTLSFYYKSYVPQNLTLTLTPSDTSIAANSVVIQNMAILSWLGSGAQFTFAGSGSAMINDDRGGGFSQPYDVTVFGNYLYAVDGTGGRILKYDIVNHIFVGWLGHIGSLEGISSTCSGNLIGDLTPGWCTGGRSNPAVSTVIYAPRTITSDAIYIYVGSNNRILRFKQSDGSYQGWVGGVSTTAPPASGQLTTCSGALASTKTPGWCLGGTVTSGTGDAYFNAISGIRAIGNYIYAADASNHRIQRFDLTSGSYQGWIGNISTTTGMTVGSACYTAGVSAASPTWCFGGTAKAANRYQLAGPPSEVAAPNEGFYNPDGIDGDSNYLYIADQSNRRVVRVDYSGAFQGWIGYIYRSSVLSPTTPSQASANYTSTWTMGGVTNDNTGTKGFCAPYGIRTDGTSIYVTDSCHKLSRVDAIDGQNEVWMGHVNTSPTGGASGCSATPVSGTTPGWCLGGAGNSVGNLNSGFYTPVGIELTSNSVYIADSNNFRIQQFDKTTGQFQNWIGASAQMTSNWSKTLPTQFARSGIDDGSFGVMTGAWTGIGTNGTSLFIADYGWNRIKQYNLANGSLIGYIGQIGTFAPTGPAQCVGFTSGLTPYWCTGGGRTGSGSGIQAYSNPTSVAADSTYIYIANTNDQRIDRVRISDSQYMGWIGDVNVTPTDGDPSCLTTAANSPTPTWCIGGTAKSGANDGMFSGLRGVFYDNATSKLFAVDNGRLMRIDPNTGNMEASLGHVTAGSGCTITGAVPNGWCTNVTGGSGTNNYGGLSNANAVAFDNTYIYVSDTGNNRVRRFVKSTGTAAGFIGQMQNATNIDTTAGTGAGCAGVTTGYPRAAQGWCHGTSIGVALTAATTPANPTSGAFNNPTGIWADDTYLYITDSNWNRIVRIDSATGSFQGWKGYISSTAGMTDSDCLAAGVGHVTPKWCTGGLSGPATVLGGFDFPSGISGDSNYLYVHDGRNNRLVTVPKN